MQPNQTPTKSRRWRRLALGSALLAGLGAVAALVVLVKPDSVDFSAGSMELKRPTEPRFEWRIIDRRFWQVVAAPVPGALPGTEGEPTEVTDAREQNGGGCPGGMVRVKGDARVDRASELGAIERLQDAACTDWISKDFPARCRTFDRDRILRDVATYPTRAMDFCIDRFEYPNVAGQNPYIVVTYREADAQCRKNGKRLCNEGEWTFACEGDEVRPYPYGFTRDAEACVVDRAWRAFSETALYPRDSAAARDELDRLWQGEASGSRPACRSPFGVQDLTGNVDEWTQTTRSSGYASVLKGGYWGPVRARCRPATRAHNEDYVGYQQGFRCCADAPASVPVTPPLPDGIETTGAPL